MEIQETPTSKYGKRYGQAEKDDILGRFAASGLKLDIFAREAGYIPTTLKRWLAGSKRVARPKLVAIRVRNPETEEKGRIEVVFPCGTTLRVDRAALAQVVNVLRRPC